MDITDILKGSKGDIKGFERMLMDGYDFPAQADALEQLYRAYQQHSPAVPRYSHPVSRQSAKDAWFQISTIALREILLRSIPDGEREFFRTLMRDKRTSREQLFAGYLRTHHENQLRTNLTSMYLRYARVHRACAELPPPVREKFDKAIMTLSSYFRKYQDILDAPYPLRSLLRSMPK
ncbi:MAG TPA: hypothetical protein VJC16_03955 [Candidatus Nanoarchaeia archaeon]|nr:hypothetical protein [Candidatus Nanoarchaeia archaeon]